MSRGNTSIDLLVYPFQFQELQLQRGKYTDDLKINQHEIANLSRVIQKLQCEHDNVKKRVGEIVISVISSLRPDDFATVSIMLYYVKNVGSEPSSVPRMVCVCGCVWTTQGVKPYQDVKSINEWPVDLGFPL